MENKCSIEELKNHFNEAYEFIQNNDLKSLEVGRYFLTNGIFANVDEYTTKPVEECRYETHKKYIDIQMLISGNESIYVNNVKSLSKTVEYDVDKDVAFYSNNIKANEYQMKENECLILYPEDGHMPCVNLNKTCNRKIVFKIPYVNVKNIKCLIMDVDGTLTDGKIYMGNDGEVFKAFDIKDGYGLAHILKKKNIVPIIVTGRNSRIVENRAKELGIVHLYQGISDKKAKINEIVKELNIELSNVSYIGDDINDLLCMEYIKNNNGLTACPNNAIEEVRNVVDFISKYNGGDGAVREVVDWVCNGK